MNTHLSIRANRFLFVKVFFYFFIYKSYFMLLGVKTKSFHLSLFFDMFQSMDCINSINVSRKPSINIQRCPQSRVFVFHFFSYDFFPSAYHTPSEHATSIPMFFSWWTKPNFSLYTVYKIDHLFFPHFWSSGFEFEPCIFHSIFSTNCNNFSMLLFVVTLLIPA